MAVIQTTVRRSNSMRHSYAASTFSGVSGADKTFDFDDQIVTSTAYRRAFQSFVKTSSASPSTKGESSQNLSRGIDEDLKTKSLFDGSASPTLVSSRSPSMQTSSRQRWASSSIVIRDSDRRGMQTRYYKGPLVKPGDIVAALGPYCGDRTQHELRKRDLLKVESMTREGWATGFKLSFSIEAWERGNKYLPARSEDYKEFLVGVYLSRVPLLKLMLL